MGYWYLRNLKKDWALNEGTTNKFDLPERGHLSGLLVRYETDNEENLVAYDNPFLMQRTDIRVVGNGNVEIINLRGRMLEAMNFWEMGVMPDLNLCMWDANAQHSYFYIPFGRYIGDPKYGLILEKFSAGVAFEDNNTFSTSYYQDGESKVSVWAVMRKDPEAGLFAGGFFKKRQIINKSCATETQYGVKLPTDNKLKQIYMFDDPGLSSNVDQTVMISHLTKLWLSIKSKEEYILTNEDVDDYMRQIYHMYKRKARTQIIGISNVGSEFCDTTIFNRFTSMAIPCTTTKTFARLLAERWQERVEKVYLYDNDGTQQSTTYYLHAQGVGYHGMVPLLMIDPIPKIEEELLDAKEKEDVYVEFTEGASTGNIYIALDELQKTYPT